MLLNILARNKFFRDLRINRGSSVDIFTLLVFMFVKQEYTGLPAALKV